MNRIYLLLIVAVLLILFGLKQQYGNSQTSSITQADSLWLDSARIELQELKQLIDETRELYRESEQQPDSMLDKDTLAVEQFKSSREAVQQVCKSKAEKDSRNFWSEVKQLFKAWFWV